MVIIFLSFFGSFKSESRLKIKIIDQITLKKILINWASSYGDTQKKNLVSLLRKRFMMIRNFSSACSAHWFSTKNNGERKNKLANLTITKIKKIKNTNLSKKLKRNLINANCRTLSNCTGKPRIQQMNKISSVSLTTEQSNLNSSFFCIILCITHPQQRKRSIMMKNPWKKRVKGNGRTCRSQTIMICRNICD